MLVAIGIVAAAVAPAGTGEASILGIGLDKWAHVLGFAVLAFSLAWAGMHDGASPPSRTEGARTLRKLLLVVLATTLFGAGVELLQWPLAWRRAGSADLVADVGGAVLGSGAWLLWRRVRCSQDR